MTKTDELRRLLDERGVEYEVRVENITGIEHIIWHPNEFSQWDWNEEFGAGWLNGWQQGVTPAQAIAVTLGPCNDSCNCTNGERTDLAAENAKLREQMERLVTLLRVDCDIEASWDGLRRFWSIGLTEDGCLMRDRACRAEAENAKLRELVRNMMQFFEDGDWCTTCECVQECDAQEQYEEDCLMRGVFHDRMRELGLEASE